MSKDAAFHSYGQKLDLGYFFRPPAYRHAPGSPRLDIWLHLTPTHEHYDPDTVELLIPTQHAEITHLKVSHPWHFKNQYQVCPGRIILRDRVGKKVEAFTFGGQMQIESQPQTTEVSISSPAPIIQLRYEDIPTLLVEEVETLLAERRAAWLPNEDGFQKRLIAAEPRGLYAACLKTLVEQFNALAPDDSHKLKALENFIKGEIEANRRQGLWPPLVSPLNQLL